MAPSATFSDEIVTADSKDVVSQTLSITDNRTGQCYTIPIVHNAISAKEFKKIKTKGEDPIAPSDQTQNGLRIYDPGLNNTAVAESKITYVLVHPFSHMFRLNIILSAQMIEMARKG